MGPDYDTPRMRGEDEPEDAAWTAMRAALTKQGERSPDNEEDPEPPGEDLSEQTFTVAPGPAAGKEFTLPPLPPGGPHPSMPRRGVGMCADDPV